MSVVEHGFIYPLGPKHAKMDEQELDTGRLSQSQRYRSNQLLPSAVLRLNMNAAALQTVGHVIISFLQLTDGAQPLTLSALR